MKNTETYKLNLIEKDDAFSPDPLNENMEKVEGALDAVRAEAAAEAAARQDADAALDQRLKVFEVRRFAMGTYRARNGLVTIEIPLEFTPEVVLVHGLNGSGASGLLYRGQENQDCARIVPNGIVIPETYSPSLNHSNDIYMYLAFA